MTTLQTDPLDMLSEIKKIPQKVLEIYEKNQGLHLPQKVYYLGLLTALYQGLGLDCFQAIEYLRKDLDNYEAK